MTRASSAQAADGDRTGGPGYGDEGYAHVTAQNAAAAAGQG